MAAAAVVGLLILAVLGIRGCRSSAREQAFKDYLGRADAIAAQSNQESRSLFRLLGAPSGQSPIQIASAVDGYRADAGALVARAAGGDHPAELAAPAAHLVQALEFRRDGLTAIAAALPSALAQRDQQPAAGRIASAMRDFVASDVIFSERVVPELRRAFARQPVSGDVLLPESRFLPDVGWLTTATVSERLATVRSGAGAGSHRLTIAGVTAQPSGSALSQGTPVQLASTPPPSLAVSVTNDGASAERGAVVKVTLSSASAATAPIQAQQQLPAIDPGGQGSVTVTLPSTPSAGASMTLTVTVVAAGAGAPSNAGKASYSVSFTH